MELMESVRLRAMPYVVARKGVALVATPKEAMHKENGKDTEGILLKNSSFRTLCVQKVCPSRQGSFTQGAENTPKAGDLRPPTRR